MKRVLITANFEASLASFRSNPLRSTLTITGVVVGIAAVVTVFSIGKGNEARVEAQVSEMGASLLWIEPHSQFRMNQVGRSVRLSVSERPAQLTIRHAELIKNNCTLAKCVAPVSSYFVRAELDGRQIQVSMIATTPEYRMARSLQILNGRYVCDLDIIALNQVCAIEENPAVSALSTVGHYLTIDGSRFRIIGVIKRQNGQVTSDVSIVAHVPLSVAQQVLYSTDQVHRIYCLADEQAGVNYLERTRRQIELVMDTDWRLHRNAVSMIEPALPFQVRSSRDVFERAESMVRTATAVTAGIGMLSLFVGGIGIMNILLASVTERTREIGVRKTVGARKRDVLLQFLFESLSLCFAGGLIGVAVGVFAANLVGTLIGLPVVLSVDAISAGVLFSMTTGMVFGIYPACKAARMTPVDALKYE